MELSPVLSVLGMLHLQDLAHLMWYPCTYGSRDVHNGSIYSVIIGIQSHYFILLLHASRGETCDFKWWTLSWITVVFCWLRLSKFAAAGESGLTPDLWTALPYVWLQSPISPLGGTSMGCICMREDCHSAARPGMHITDPTFTSSSHLSTDAATIFLSDTPILSYHLNLWSPATRFLGRRHGNLKLPLGNRGSVRHENDFKESRKQRFGPQCGPAPAKHRLTLLCSFCVEV